MYQICVSGAAKGSSVEESHELARQIGKEIALAGHTLMTGATVGLPNYAAEGYKKAGGKMSLGISPASSKAEHVLKYTLPTTYYDCILYTGLHYVGRDALLITSSDAVISVGGRIGTLHEFTISIESDTPIGFLEGSGGIEKEIINLLSVSKPLRKDSFVIFEKDAKSLLSKLTAHLDQKFKDYHDLYY